MCAKHYENPTMLSRVTAKNVGDVFFETHCRIYKYGFLAMNLSKVHREDTAKQSVH